MSGNIIEEEGVSASKLDSILRKVQGLLSKAEHPNTGEAEADAFRQKAEDLMQRYRIEESMLMQADPGSAVRPVYKVWGVCEASSPYMQEFFSLFVYCCRHAGVRMTYTWGPDPDNDGKSSLLGQMVGYEADVRYAIMLYAGIRMAFSGKLEPRVDASLSDEENVYNLRNAGVERIRIASMMGWGTSNSACGRVTAVYKRACLHRGEDPVLTGKGNSVALYRKSFAEAFVSRIYFRLSELRTRAGTDSAGALVLSNRQENVDEAFYERFPDLRPKPATAGSGAGYKAAGRQRKYVAPKQSALGLAAGRRAAEEADITGRGGPTAARKLT